MRTLKLIYPHLAEKRIGHKLAIRDELQLRHLKVLRADADNYRYQVADGEGTVAEVKLLKNTKEGALFEVVEIATDFEVHSGVESILVLPLIRLPLLEQALQQVTQLNIYQKIYLYFSEFTRYSEREISTNKLTRFEKLLTNAFTQSQSKYLPKLELKESLAEALANNTTEESFCFVPSLTGTAFDFADLAEKVSSNHKQKLLILGSEGGFSPSELKLLESLPSKYIAKFGDSVLTTETAAIVFSGLFKAVLS